MAKYGSSYPQIVHWLRVSAVFGKGEFRNPERPRASACFCAKTRLMRVTSHKEDKQTEKTAVELPKKGTIWNAERFWRSQNAFTSFCNHCFKQQRENQLVITKKNNEPNQNLTEIVFGEWVKKNAKMVLKSLNKVTPCSHFNVVFSGEENFFKVSSTLKHPPRVDRR